MGHKYDQSRVHIINKKLRQKIQRQKNNSFSFSKFLRSVFETDYLLDKPIKPTFFQHCIISLPVFYDTSRHPDIAPVHYMILIARTDLSRVDLTLDRSWLPRVLFCFTCFVWWIEVFPNRHFAGNDKGGESNQVAVEQVITFVRNNSWENLGSCQLGGYIEAKSSVFASTKTD